MKRIFNLLSKDFYRDTLGIFSHNSISEIYENAISYYDTLKLCEFDHMNLSMSTEKLFCIQVTAATKSEYLKIFK